MKCPTCGEETERIIKICDTTIKAKVMCSCRIKEQEEKKRIEENREKQDRLERLFKNSLMDSKFRKETFKNWDKQKGSRTYYNIGMKYCKNFKEIRTEGLGMMLQGRPGNGKTYLSNCIANYLLDTFTPVISISINDLLDRLKQNYNRWEKEGEAELIKSITRADLIILDDLGTENPTDWAISKVYSIIDAIYRAKKCLIVSTNYSLQQLRDQYGERTISRLEEMCTTITIRDKSFRESMAEENRNKLRSLIMEG